MDLSDAINGLLVLIVGGVLGGIGTYFIKPPLDDWLERRKKAREARRAARQKKEALAKQQQEAGQYALEYRDKLVRELRNLRILDMVRPLDLERTYVRVSIQEEQPRRYAEAEEMAALAKGDPNLLFELSQDKLAEDKAESLPPEEALKRYRHLVVLGDPGAGKTTMLKYLCLLSAQSKLSGLPDLPLFVTLNRFIKANENNLFDFIVSDVTSRYGFQQPRRYLESRLNKGSVLLLVDGLDEVTVGNIEEAEAAYRHTVNQINQLAIRYPKCPLVVTSRRAGWKGWLGPNFMIMAVLDFTWEDIQRFIDNWFGQGSDRSRDLQNKLAQQSRMQALAANPLLLSLIAIVFNQDLELPERRAKLYERCVYVLLTEWDAHRGIKRAGHFTADRKRDLLEDIALHFHGQGLRYFQKNELLKVIAAYLPTVDIPAEQAGLVLDEISAQHGLLKEQAADWYGFLHLTLQEYFTAVSLDKGNQTNLALANMYNPWWEEVLLLLAGMIKDAAPLLDAILADRDDIFFSNLLLAGRCLAGTPRIRRVELRRQIVDDLKALIENESKHWLPRTQAIRSLREAEGERSSAYLLCLIPDQTIRPQVRTAVVDALSSTSDKSVVQDLLDILPNEQIDASVRERLADSLTNFCHKSATPYLLSLLPNQEIDPMVRGDIARSLGLLDDKSAIPGLLDMLLNEAVDSHVGWRVSHALVYDLRAFSTPKDLRALLDNENINHVFKWALAQAVSNFDPTAYPELVEWISDESLEQEIRWHVARLLGNLNLDDEAIKNLQRLYSANSLPLSIQACVGITLLQSGERQVANELKVLLVHPGVDHYVKMKIAQALVEGGEKDIAPQLLVVLREDYPSEFSYVRLKMADLLAKLGDSTIAGELLEFLRDEQVKPHIRVRAADALNALDLSGLTTDIKTFISNPAGDALVRGRAAFCLAQDENGVAWLIELIAQDDIREEVYAALRFAARQANVRVFAAPDGGYEVVPLQ